MNINDLISKRWGVSPRSSHNWQASVKRRLVWRYEAALNGALGCYGTPRPPGNEDPKNLTQITRTALTCAGYSYYQVNNWQHGRGSATPQQLSARMHDLVCHYLNTKPWRSDPGLPIPIY
ncbi:TPA: hypothetical protein NJ746_004558 [Vibrio parahaemolyticus]|nr:hypothetical protein [Vibrio parahaemolyticus]